MRYEGPLSAIGVEALLDGVEAKCRDVAGVYIFGGGRDTLASVVVGQLRASGQTLGTVESCTGGLLGAYLTDVPGSSAAFIGGLVTYTNQLKSALAHVDAANFAGDGPGAVSRETARAMALGGLQTLACDHTLAITGIAGPDGGTADKPVGLVYIARASRGDEEVDVRAFKMLGDRQNIREWSAKTAMAMLWQKLAGLPGVKMLRESH
jgi:nicotinamide-nucleotide amidase